MLFDAKDGGTKLFITSTTVANLVGLLESSSADNWREFIDYVANNYKGTIVDNVFILGE